MRGVGVDGCEVDGEMLFEARGMGRRVYCDM